MLLSCLQGWSRPLDDYHSFSHFLHFDAFFSYIFRVFVIDQNPAKVLLEFPEPVNESCRQCSQPSYLGNDESPEYICRISKYHKEAPQPWN